MQLRRRQTKWLFKMFGLVPYLNWGFSSFEAVAVAEHKERMSQTFECLIVFKALC